MQRNVIAAPDEPSAWAEARSMYPGKSITNLHQMDEEHGAREVQADEWLEALPSPIKFMAALFVVSLFAIGSWWHDRRQGHVGH